MWKHGPLDTYGKINNGEDSVSVTFCVCVCVFECFFSHCVSSGFGDRNKKNGNYPRVQKMSIMNVKGKEMK